MLIDTITQVAAISGHIVQAAPGAGGGGGGILDWVNQKGAEGITVFRTLASLAGVGAIVVTAVRSRGAAVPIIVSGLTAGLLVWLVFNVTTVKDKVDTEVNGSGQITHTVPLSPASASRSATSPPTAR